MAGLSLKQQPRGRAGKFSVSALKSRGDALSYTEIDSMYKVGQDKPGVCYTPAQWIRIRKRIRSYWLVFRMKSRAAGTQDLETVDGC